MSGALGFGKSSSNNQSTAQSESAGISQGYSDSTQDIAFKNYFANLYGGASRAADPANIDTSMLNSAARDLFTGGTNFLASVGGDNAGTSYEKSRLGDTNTALENQITQLGLDENKFLTNVALPGITTNSVASGGLGNDRQGIAQGTAIAAANKDFLTQAATLRANDVNQRDAVAANLAGQTLQGAATGLGALPSMFDLLQNSSAPMLGIYKQLGGILGGPTTLTQQFSQQFAQNASRGTSQSSGSARAWNFNMAGGVGTPA